MNLIDFSLFFIANMVFQLLIKTLKLWFFANWTIHISNLNFNWLYLLERQYFIYSSLFKVLSSNLKNLCDSFIIFLFLIERLIYICRVTNCSPHLNRNRKCAQQAQYNKFVREWVKELGQQRFLQQLLESWCLAEDAKTQTG